MRPGLTELFSLIMESQHSTFLSPFYHAFFKVFVLGSALLRILKMIHKYGINYCSTSRSDCRYTVTSDSQSNYLLGIGLVIQGIRIRNVTLSCFSQQQFGTDRRIPGNRKRPSREILLRVLILLEPASGIEPLAYALRGQLPHVFGYLKNDKH